MGDTCGKFLHKIQAPTMETDELGKAKSFRLFSIKRPHMRSFHCSWFCFFLAFTTWFGIQPLLPTIRRELDLSKTDIGHSGTASIAATIGIRVIVGPLCDYFGPRRIMSFLLIVGSIPMALAGLVKDATGLIILRLFVGVLGGCFVPCQFWTTAMYNSEIIGTANALVGGWGNLGGGFTFILMPGVFELIKICGAHEFLAWKIAVAVPAFICIITGISIIFTSDDCPQGLWIHRKLPESSLEVTPPEKPPSNQFQGVDNVGFDSIAEKDVADSTMNGKACESQQAEMSIQEGQSQKKLSKLTFVLTVITVGILVIQYGICFGIEISVNTAMNLYFLYNFQREGCSENATVLNTSTNVTSVGIADDTTILPITVSSIHDTECSILDQNTASLIASLFGLTNLFARALGGLASDVVFKYRGIPGRLFVHFLCLALEGVMLMVFSQIRTISTAIVVMVFFSLFVQMSEGATYAVVPYLIPSRIGIVAGLVGAGGNGGGLIWTSIWSQLVDTDPSRWFFILGIIVLCGSVLSSISHVQGDNIWKIFIRRKNYNVGKQ